MNRNKSEGNTGGRVRFSTIVNRLLRFPGKSYTRFGRWQLLPFVLLTAAAGILIARIDFKTDLHDALPEDDPYYELEERFNEGFPAAEFVIVFVDGDPFSKNRLRQVEEISASLQSIGQVASVLSVATLKDARVKAGELIFEKVYRGPETNISLLEEHILETKIFSKYLLSADQSAWNIFVFFSKGFSYKEVIPEILNVVEQKGKGVAKVAGDEISRHYMEKTAFRELFLLGGVALLLVLIIETLISRSFLIGLALAATALLPVIWTLAMFPLFGYQIRTYNVFLPVFILSIATSYSIHVYRYYSVEDRGDKIGPIMPEVLDSISPIVVSAGFTTFIGFLSLLLTPLNVLREIGILILFGIFFSLLAALFFFPPLLVQVNRNSRVQNRRKDERRMERFFTSGRITALLKPRNIVVLLIINAALIGGIYRIRTDYRRSNYFMPRTEVYSMLEAFHNRNGASEEVEIVVDIKKEYGLMNPGTFNSLDICTEAIETLQPVSTVLSVTEIINWFNGRLLGEDKPVKPETEYAIGEAVELLSYEKSILGVNSLVNEDYSKIKLVVQFDALGCSLKEANILLHDLRRKIDLIFSSYIPDADYAVFGLPITIDKSVTYLLRSQLIAFGFFFAFLLLFLLLVLRSIKWAAVVLIPTLSAIIFYLGILGWFQISVTAIVIFIVVAVLGVSNDDILYFILVFRRGHNRMSAERALVQTFERTGVAIVQTTLIILISLIVLLFSEIKTIVTAGFLGAMALGVGTTVTCLVIPVILRYIYRWKKKDNG